MVRRSCIIILLLTAFVFVLLPSNTANARNITFGDSPVVWHISIKACQNGFSVTATGNTYPDVNIWVVAVDATLLLPNDKPPFIRQTKQLTFSSETGSMLVASASDVGLPVTGTANFFFTENVAINAPLRTTIAAYTNGAPVKIPNDTGIDYVKRCTLSKSPPLATDLSAAQPVNPALIGNGFGNDGRANPSAADPVAVYCLNRGAFAGTIVVNGIDGSGNAFRLSDFKVNALQAARPNAISKAAFNNQGDVALGITSKGFTLEWHLDKAVRVKNFACSFDKSAYNKTDNQLLFPNAFGNDGRVAPVMTDLVAVYCRTGKNVIDIVGIDTTHNGYELATFKYADVVAASPNPVIQTVPQQGTVKLQVDSDDNFYLQWENGPYGTQTKGFKCRF